jgi:polyisoprenoid-binding protein YceI
MRSMHLLALSWIAAFAAFVLTPGMAGAQARTFKVDSSGGSQIQFVSDAPLEKFTGKSTGVSGEIKVDPNAPATGSATIKVEIATLKTGIDLRDEHIRNESWLDAKKYPYAEFVVTRISGVEKLKPGEAVEATVTGKFSLHGVTKELTTKARVRLTPGEGGKDSLRVVTSFTVKLEEHKVSIPSIVALKVSPEIVVNVDIRATAE